MGLQPIVMPLFEGAAVEWTAPDPTKFDALLLTSANAIKYGGEQLERFRDLPTYCVGGATAQAAEDAGFNIIAIGRGGVDSLLVAVPTGSKLLHLGAANRREPGTAGRNIEHVPVYQAAERPVPDRLGKVEGAVVAVHSPRAGATFARMVDEAKLDRNSIAIAAISREAAQSAGEGWQSIETAAEPTDAAILAIASRLCNNPG